MNTVDVVGIGLDGVAGLTSSVRQILGKATLLVGSDRHLSYFPDHPGERLVLGDILLAIAEIKQRLDTDRIAVLVTGDPLFFGLGRLLKAQLPEQQLRFYPHLSSIQLAFNRIKIPWHDARTISIHGRGLDELTEALRLGVEKIAVLTDDTNSPSAIAGILLALDLPSHYQFWICENLGGADERVQILPVTNVTHQQFDPLNVVILIRQQVAALDLEALPQLGLPDRTFLTFSDRPSLMTKREIRLLILGELALQPGQIIWDIGAGTGSVSIEIARLFSSSQVYAIEQTAAGTTLIEQNCLRFQVNNVTCIYGQAPTVLEDLPTPDRIFLGGTGGNLTSILGLCAAHLVPGGVLVMACATLEHLHEALKWMRDRGWIHRLLQVQLSRSVPIAHLTRFSPLNPVTILTTERPS